MRHTHIYRDDSTLYIDGKPVFVYSGEFHYWRIPVPSLWLDIFQKLRATGYNAVSIYFHWGYHNPKEGVWDFETGGHDIQAIFDAAKTAGLWVIARPGPYIHAETSAGGLPGWLVQLPKIEVRTNGTEYTKYWKEYVTRIGKIIARNQVGRESEGGTGTVVLAQIENEYYWGGGFKYEGSKEYMTMISQAYRDVGIDVPIFHNDVGMARSWLPKNYPGVLDLYGLDGYPRGFDCDDPIGNFRIRTDYYRYFKRWYPHGPQFTPEFQGGAFDPWGGPGYEMCAEMVGTNFVNVYYKNNIAQRFTMMSFYMAFGGTNWGYLLTPCVYTSYDYGAGISETRLLREKINEGKLIALFLRSSDSLLHADLIGNSTSPSNGVQYSANPAVYATELYNPSTETRYYVIRHSDTNSLEEQKYDLRVNSTYGEMHLTGLRLRSRESKILTTGYKAGNSRIAHATSEILTWQNIDGTDTVFFVLDVQGQGQEVSVAYECGPQTVPISHIVGRDRVGVTATCTGELLKVAIEFDQGYKDMLQITLVAPVLNMVFLSKPYVYKFWAPVAREGPGKVEASEQILVHGPYLVRNATIEGNTVHLVGDLTEDTKLIVWISMEIIHVTWNGEEVKLSQDSGFSRFGWLKGPDRSAVKLPNLRKVQWKMFDSLPEIDVGFDDSKWAVARDHSTNEAFPPLTLPCLYAGEYGFHTGAVIYRGRFHTIQSGGTVAAIFLEIWGGTAFGYSAWINGKPLHARPGNAWSERFIDLINFKPGQLRNDGKENIIVIVADSNGYDRDNGVTFFDGHTTKKPRGIKAARLIGREENMKLEFLSWRLQGNAGGEDYDDVVRAPYNEDGLYAERIGAHFNDFNDTNLPTHSPFIGVPSPGITFYRTSFNITFPSSYDVPISLVLGISDLTKARVLIFINGYQMGRYVNHIGPQTEFPIFPGIINNGENVLGLAVWGMDSYEDAVNFEELYFRKVEVLSTGYAAVDGVKEGLVPGMPKGGRKEFEAVQQVPVPPRRNGDGEL
ncbi:glycoside hydrolase superfamily [Peziza echinospora]|nr:glycoside hydrolase superfamily [Peziza echinospora]